MPLRRIFFLILVVFFLVPGTTIADSSAPATDSVDHAYEVAKLLGVEDTMMPVFHSMLPNQESKDLADKLLNDDPDFWDRMTRDLADLYRKSFTEAQLKEIYAFFSSETGRAWIVKSPDLIQGLQDATGDQDSAMFRFASTGCVVGMVGPSIQEAKQQHGITDEGLSDELFEQIRPLREAATMTCECIFSKGMQRFPGVPVTSLGLEPGFQEFVQEMLSTDRCPLPVPQP